MAICYRIYPLESYNSLKSLLYVDILHYVNSFTICSQTIGSYSMIYIFKEMRILILFWICHFLPNYASCVQSRKTGIDLFLQEYYIL